MSVKELFQTQSVWEAACLTYLYGIECLVEIVDEEIGNRRRLATYSLAVPSEDVKIVLEDYRADRLALSSAKAFVASYNEINSKQRTMRERCQSHWSSPAWIRGEV
jgi:hypothetical protein